MARLLRTRRTWLIALALLAATTGVIVSLLVLAGPTDVRFTATLYSDVIRFEADGVASLRVTIYDLAEKELWSSGQVMGDFVDWDRTNERGERLANGYYIYLAQGWDFEGHLVVSKTGKVVLLPGDQVELRAAPVESSRSADSPADEPVYGPLAYDTTNWYVSGRLGVGTDSPAYTVHVRNTASALNVESAGIVARYRVVDDDSNGPTVVYLKARGTFTSPTSAQGGDGLGGFLFMAHDGTAYRYSAAIRGFLDGSIGPNDMPGRLLFQTSPDGTDSLQDRMVIRNNGRVGIGTTNPSKLLHVDGDTAVGGDLGVGTANMTDRLTIEGSSGNLIACYPDSSRMAGAAVFRVESDGDVYADGTVYSSTTAVGSADVAERINTSEWVEAGDVVEIDPEHVGFFRKASGMYSRRVAGIISTSPGVILGNDVDDATDQWDDNRPVLAIAGRVPVKTSTENGPIAVGDLLVSSSAAGVAMKGDPAVSIGAVVGKAMEPLESGEGVIMAQVTLR